MSDLLDRVRGALIGLKMPRALEALDHTMHQLEQGEITGIEAIDELLSEEYATRESRRIDVALRTAKLMPIKTLEGFDFSFQPSIDRERIAALAQLDFIRHAEVVHFLGPPGIGKSHLATALGVAAVRAGKSVYRATLAELIEALAKAEREGRLAEKIRFYTRASLLIVDEIGYLPITQGGANVRGCARTNGAQTPLTLPAGQRAVRERRDDLDLKSRLRGVGRGLGDPVVATALLDRLLHHAVVLQIEGASYRLRSHADLIPEHVRANAPIAPPPPPKRRGRPPKNKNGAAHH